MSTNTDTRERMIEAAMTLFHQQGIKGTSVDDILKRSRTGKGQFTHYFKNKEGLVRSVVNYLQDLIKTGKAPTGYNLKTWSDFDSWFGKYINFQKKVNCELSCPLGTIGNDLNSEQELLRQDIIIFFEWCTRQLSRFFAEKRAAGELSKRADPDALADFCLTVMEGGMLMSKIKRDLSIFENASSQAIAYIHSLRR